MMNIPFWLKLFKPNPDSQEASSETIRKMAFYLSQNKKIIVMGGDTPLEIKVLNNKIVVNPLVETKDFNWK